MHTTDQVELLFRLNEHSAVLAQSVDRFSHVVGDGKGAQRGGSVLLLACAKEEGRERDESARTTDTSRTRVSGGLECTLTSGPILLYALPSAVFRPRGLVLGVRSGPLLSGHHDLAMRQSGSVTRERR